MKNYSPDASPVCSGFSEENILRHSLAGQFPTVSLFKEYQNASMAILEKSDYTMIFGNPYIKKSGWRKISFYFNMSYEIKDKTIEFDENQNVQRAEFVVRAYMQGERFLDGWGSCERHEKRFMKPNQDIPSTAETRAKNKAFQVFHKRMPLEVIDLTSRLLQYSPRLRCTALFHQYSHFSSCKCTY